MSAHSYSLRSRLSNTVASVKTPTNSPTIKATPRSPRKQSRFDSGLHLKHVIGTTTATPGGLSCCESTNSFAYCAGSVAVLADLNADSTVNYRYFKAHPTAIASNPTSTQYDSASNNNIPIRRASVFLNRRGLDDSQNNSFGREWLDDSSNQTWSARERIKAATCVSLSPDGKLLAVGETGYNPRVLLFSTSVTASVDTPLAIITEHSIGIRNIAFSPDSKYLATLGDVNDGYLYIWTVNTKSGEVKLHSTNKCTTSVCDMTWCGNNVVTVGTRHIKIWQVLATPKTSPQKRARLRMEGEQIPSPGPTPLPGRNCLLGKMVDSTFTAIVAVSSERAIVCSDDGDICVLDISRGNAVLSSVEVTDAPIAAVSHRTNAGRIIWMGKDGLEEKDPFQLLQASEQLGLINVNGSRKLRKRPSGPFALLESPGLIHPTRASVVALSCLADYTIYIDAGGSLHLLRAGGDGSGPEILKFSSHSDLIKGVQMFPSNSDLGSFFTWARNGELAFWGSEGRLIRIENVKLDQLSGENDAAPNELRVVRYAETRKRFITGDRYGVVRLINQESWMISQAFRAHSTEVTDIAIHDTTSMIATCSRDRTLQIFRWHEHEVELLQTADDHISAVHHVIFTDDGSRLLSCSGDRTIIIRDRIEREIDGVITTAFLSARVITLKGSPLSMSLLPTDQNILYVSTMDRYVIKLDVNSGTTIDTFKVSDKDTDDTTMLNSISLSCSQKRHDFSILVGCSSIDKSIRLYDLQKGYMLDRDWGHTEGVSDMTLLDLEGTEQESCQQNLVSTGLDSTIMIWSITTSVAPLLTPLQELSEAQATLSANPDATASKGNPASLPPLRKILTKMEVAGFSRQSSPSRDPSPHRLGRKTSKLTLSTSIEEASENVIQESTRARSGDKIIVLEKRSPSPNTTPSIKPRKQRSKPDLIKTINTKATDWQVHSPTLPSIPLSVPTTPKQQRGSNGRLRRAPSIPTDLRTQSSNRPRRQSVSVITDCGSISMASEATSRMLKTYRKKLESSKGEMDFKDVEKELETVLQLIKEKKAEIDETKNHNESRSNIGNTNDAMNGLTARLEEMQMSR